MDDLGVVATAFPVLFRVFIRSCFRDPVSFAFPPNVSVKGRIASDFRVDETKSINDLAKDAEYAIVWKLVPGAKE
jgi:hypothetical protein